jgi:P2 family phage contractile tail tube protein
MGLPRNLKDLMIFNEGRNYVGDAMAFTQPKLVRKLEEHRAGGMDRPVKIDMGGEPLECEFVTASPMRDVLRQYGGGISSVQLRLVGTYQNDETGMLDTIEISVGGRHEEIDPGESKLGEKTEMKVKMALVYYKLDWNGRTELEIDVINMIEIVNGVDLLADRRAALGI